MVDKKVAMVLVSLLLIVIIVAFFKGNFSTKKGSRILIGDNEYFVEIADSVVSQANGLSGREGLEEGGGMLFVFKNSKERPFWMKGMKFPIDIIWINDNKVIGFSENVELDPDNSSKMFHPPSGVDMVFEVNIGVVIRDNIQVGDIVELLE